MLVNITYQAGLFSGYALFGQLTRIVPQVGWIVLKMEVSKRHVFAVSPDGSC